MRSSIFRSAVLGFGILLAGSTIVPAEAAMPMPNPSVAASSDVQIVRDQKGKIRRNRGHVRASHNFRAARHVTRNRVSAARKHVSKNNRGWRNTRNYRNGYHYWNGHRGYRSYRPGYRLYGGWWYPSSAFSVGVVIGSHPHGNRHVRWCYSHYRSYRASDNTFQPNSGPRKQCVSPF